jgi:GNAT superfamily N-acetyltransferase
MTDYELVSPIDVSTWRSYHDIRRDVLFEARGRGDVYDENHPDERAPGNHPKLLLYRGDPVGVIRIDIASPRALLRRVAIRTDVQRSGHGRVLLSLAERFAAEHGCRQLESHVASDAVDFYQKCGFVIDGNKAASAGRGSVLMKKDI